MRKIALGIMFLIFQICSFSSTDKFENEIYSRRMDIKKAIASNVFISYGTICADIVEADMFLELLNTSKQDLSNNRLVLVFPDINYINKYIRDLSTRMEEVKIYLLENKTNAYRMQDRSYEELLEKGYDKVLKGLKNVNLIKVNLGNEELKDVYIDSFVKGILENELYKKLNINWGK